MTDRLAAARDLLRRFPLVDGHNDLPWAIREQFGRDPVRARLSGPVATTQTDLPRLAEGHVGAQFWSVYVPASLAGDTAVTAVLEQIDLVHRMIRAYPERLELATTAADVERVFAAGKIASLLGAEGGHAIASSLGVLRALYALGVRYLTLTHNNNVGWADAATDEPEAGGLTDFGREVVREMQRIGMLVDLSHVAVSTMHDTLDIAQAPVIFSHSSARAVCDHPRNVPDDVLTRLAGNHGVCMVTFVPFFVSPDCARWQAGLLAELDRRGLDRRDISSWETVVPHWQAAHPVPEATLAQVADHIEHVRAVAGIEHVGLGGDYDGFQPGLHRPGRRLGLPGAVRRTAGPRLDQNRLRRPGRRQPAARPAGRGEGRGTTWPRHWRGDARIARDDRSLCHFVRVPSGPRP